MNLNLDLGSLGKDADPTATGKAKKPDNSIVILLLLSVLAIAPSLVIMMTSFTRMIVVLSMVRNAVGLQSIPPNQGITGLALFLSLFVMAPTLKQVNDQALQPYLKGDMKRDQIVTVHWANKNYNLPREATTTGADRFHDAATGMDLVVIPTKAMLFSDKDSSRLADECKTPEMAQGAPAPTQSRPRRSSIRARRNPAMS